MFTLRFFRFLLPFLLVSSSHAADFSDQPSWAERNYLRVSVGLHDSANWLDRFFADDRFEEEQAWTRLKLQWTTSGAEHEDMDHDIRLRGKIILPNLEKRWQLVFEGDPEDDDITGLERDSESTTSLRYIVKENLKRRLSIDAGIRGGFNNPSFRTKVEYRVEKEDHWWLYRLRPSIEWDSRDLLKVTLRFDAERQLENLMYFRMSSTPRWREEETGMEFSQDFTVFKELCPRRYLAFDWLNTLKTKPHHRLEVSRLRVRYRREIWRDKLFMEVAPGVRFQAEDHHRVEAEAYFRLELFFQEKPEVPAYLLNKDETFDSGPMFEEDPYEYNVIPEAALP